GGGPVMLAVMDQEFRCRKKILSDSEMNDILAIIYSMPGAIGVNAALNIGYKLAGRKGSASPSAAAPTSTISRAAWPSAAPSPEGIPVCTSRMRICPSPTF
ncbi:MAG: chromate transporter, partial [Oscillospiraceae bacterium]|nr:chromate transporter [Oscillospiraceae bacterium]